MYGKLFASIYDGTLATKGPWQALVTFQQLVTLADVDGVVDMTAEAIARRTTVPIEIIGMGIAALEQPDPDSRTPTEEGRRIVRLSDSRPWGWRIVNYAFYRDLRNESDRRTKRRDYHKEYARSKRKDRQQRQHKRQQKSTSLNTSQQHSTELPHTDADVITTPTKGGGWVGRFLTALTDVTKGTYPAGRLGADLKALIVAHGEAEVYPAWLTFVASTDRRYGPLYFAKNYGDYLSGAKRNGHLSQEEEHRKRGWIA